MSLVQAQQEPEKPDAVLCQAFLFFKLFIETYAGHESLQVRGHAGHGSVLSASEAVVAGRRVL